MFKKIDEHLNVPHRAYNTHLLAHPCVSDDGVSITKCLTEHIVMILMLIDFAYHDITGQVQKYYL